MASVPILIFPLKLTRPFRFLTPLARSLMSKKIRGDIDAAEIDVDDPEQYIIASIFSSFMWSFSIFFLILLVQSYSVSPVKDQNLLVLPFLIFIVMFFTFFALHMFYPAILSKKVAELTDKKLLHLLRDMWVQATSGVMLYNILQNVARANYGVASKDLQDAVREISAGERDSIVLEKVAAATRSESFRRVLWHIIASMRTGIGLKTAFESAVNILADEQRRKVKEYAASLNFYLLMYLLFAAVIPAILITFLSLLSIFGVFALSIEILSAIVVGFVFLQFIVIGFMRVGRPEIA